MSGLNHHSGGQIGVPPSGHHFSSGQSSTGGAVPTSSVHLSQISIRVITSNLINALHLLGFDFQAAERQHKLVFNAATFTKPNPKAFELAVHFLLCQLDPERAQRAFAQCWPAMLKEQQKEFKDVIFAWLLELSTKSSASSQQQAKTAAASSWQTVTSPHHQSLLQAIKFPIVTKSLLLSPGGLKICELLMALALHVVLFRLIKLVETNKSNVRLWPKVSLLQNVLHENRQQLQHSSGGIRLLTAKQIAQFEVQIASMKRVIAATVSDFHSFIKKQLLIRAQLQQYAADKRQSITISMQRVQELKSSVAKKKALCAQLLMSSDENPNAATLDSLYERFNASKLDEYNRAYAEFDQITRQILSSGSSNIDQILCVKTNRHRIDGEDFKRNVFGSDEKQDETASSQNKNLSEKIFRFIYENMDRNETIRHSKIGDLFDKDDKKLDIVNLIRLFNAMLMLKGDLLYKINLDELSKFNMNNKSFEDETLPDMKLLDIDLFDMGGASLANSGSQDSSSELASINRQASELKRKLEIYLPKLTERIESLTKKITSGVRSRTGPAFKRDAFGVQNEHEKLNARAVDLFEDYIGSSKLPIADRARLEEAIAQQMELAASQPDLGAVDDADGLPDSEVEATRPRFDFELEGEMGLKDFLLSARKTDEKPFAAPIDEPSNSRGEEEAKEFLLSDETDENELLQNESCESLTSTKLVDNNMLVPSHVNTNPLSPINNSDAASPVKNADSSNHEAADSSGAHSSLQIIDFSDGSNMDLI